MPTRTSVERGSCSSARFSVWSESAGIVSATSSRDAAAKESFGRRMTRSAHRAQNGDGPTLARPRPILPALTRPPRIASRAGSSVTVAASATATTMIAASAIDCTARTGTIQIDASETITVSPEKTTATPDVRIEPATDSSTPAPASSSSRNRASTNIE